MNSWTRRKAWWQAQSSMVFFNCSNNKYLWLSFIIKIKHEVKINSYLMLWAPIETPWAWLDEGSSRSQQTRKKERKKERNGQGDVGEGGVAFLVS